MVQYYQRRMLRHSISTYCIQKSTMTTVTLLFQVLHTRASHDNREKQSIRVKSSLCGSYNLNQGEYCFCPKVDMAIVVS